MAVPNYGLNVGVRDGEGKIGVMSFYGNFLTDAAARTAASALYPLIQDLTAGVIAYAELKVRLLTSNEEAPQNVDNEKGALFTFNDVDLRAVQVRLPARIDGIMLPNSDTVNPVDEAVAAFTDAVISDGWLSARAIDIVSFRGAVEDWSKRNKRKG